MSFKVFNGYHLPGKYSIAQLVKKFDPFREQVEKLNEKIVGDLILDEAVFAHDMMMVGATVKIARKKEKKAELKSLLWDLWDKWREEWHESRAKSQFSLIMTEVELILYQSRRNGIGILFFGPREAEELLKKVPGVRYYGYWNNTDPDETCSKKEWQDRKKLWEGAFSKKHRPMDIGLSLRAATSFPYVNFYELLKHQPSVQKRLSNVARGLLRERAFQKRLREWAVENKTTVDTASFSDMSALYREIEDTVKNEEAMESVRKEIAPYFTKPIDPKDVGLGT